VTFLWLNVDLSSISCFFVAHRSFLLILMAVRGDSWFFVETASPLYHLMPCLVFFCVIFFAFWNDFSLKKILHLFLCAFCMFFLINF